MPVGSSVVVNPVKGTLITCDPPMKEVICSLNRQQAEPFILLDLDATHLFVKREASKVIRKAILEAQEEWVYTRPISGNG